MMMSILMILIFMIPLSFISFSFWVQCLYLLITSFFFNLGLGILTLMLVMFGV